MKTGLNMWLPAAMVMVVLSLCAPTRADYACCVDGLYCISVDPNICDALGGTSAEVGDGGDPCAAWTDGPCANVDTAVIPPAGAEGGFGQSIDLEFVNGHVSHLVVGSPGAAAMRGMATVMEWIVAEGGSGWVADQTFTLDPTTLNPGDRAGTAVVTGGDWIAVGIPGRQEVRMYHREGGSWIERQTLVPINNGGDEEFGAALALDGSTLFVGAPGTDGGGGGGGRITVFVNTGDAEGEPWAFTQHLEVGAEQVTGFGASIAIDDAMGRAIIGAPNKLGGGAYSAQLLDGAWTITKNLADDLPTAYGELGLAVELVDDYAYVSNPGVNITGTTLGVVWAYTWEEDEGADGGTSDFTMTTFVAPPDGMNGTQFGTALSLQPGILLVGSPNEDDTGAVHVYTYTGDDSQMIGLTWHSRVTGATAGARYGSTLQAGWTSGVTGGLALAGSPGAASEAGRVDTVELGNLDSADGTTRPPYDFAQTIDTSEDGVPQQIEHRGDWAIAGWPNHPSGQGGVRLFKFDGTNWSAVGSMVHGTTTGFGWSITMLDGIAAVGSPNANGSGVVHLYSYSDAGLASLTTLDPGAAAQSGAGSSVALAASPSGDMLLSVGAPALDTVDPESTPHGPGTIYFYGRPAGQDADTWSLHSIDQENPGNTAEWGGLGYALDVVWYQDQFNIMAGQPCHQIPGKEVAGGVAHLRGTLDSSSMEFVSTVNISEEGSRFGTSLEFEGDTLVVGAPGTSTNAPYGAIHVVRYFLDGIEQTEWIQLLPGDQEYTGNNVRYGASVAASTIDGALYIAAGIPQFSLASTAGVEPGAIDLYARTSDEEGEDRCLRQVRVMPRIANALDAFGAALSFQDGHLLFANGVINTSAPQATPSFAAYGARARSYWLNPAGGDDAQIWNWSLPPESGDTIVFSLLESTVYFVAIDTLDSVAIEVEYDSPILSRFGDVRGTTPPLTSLTIASDADIRTANVLLSGGFNFTDSIRVGSAQSNDSGGLHVFGATSIGAGSYIQQSNGALMLSLTSNTNLSTPFMSSGTIELQGSLALNMDTPTKESLVAGQQITLLQTMNTPPDDTRFDLALLPGLPNDLALVINYGFLGRGAPWSVYADVVSLSGLLDFGDPNSIPVTGEPVDVEVVDLTGDGADEICVIFAGAPGTLSVFENDGAGGVVQQLTLSISDDPVGITSGDFDGDGTTDLAYASAGVPNDFINGSITILHNEDLDISNGFENPYTHPISGSPTCLAAINWDDMAPQDLVVGVELTPDWTFPGLWQVLLATDGSRNRDMMDGPSTVSLGIPIDVDPKPDEDEAPKDANIRFIGTSSVGQVVVGKRNLLRHGGAIDVDVYSVGVDLQGLTSGDINGDGRFDIAAVSSANSQLGVLLGDTTSSDGFLNPVYVSPGTQPSGLISIDFDLDGNIDLATISTDTDGNRGVRVLQNDGNLIFTAVETAAGESPSLIEVGDVSGNGVSELVTITGGTTRGAGGNLLSLRTVNDVVACTGDLDGNAVVDVIDLLALIAAWGECSGCPADLDGNAVVDVIDLLALIAAWGECIS